MEPDTATSTYKLGNGFDHKNKAFVELGKYVRCGHIEDCQCYGKTHEGQEVNSASRSTMTLFDDTFPVSVPAPVVPKPAVVWPTADPYRPEVYPKAEPQPMGKALAALVIVFVPYLILLNVDPSGRDGLVWMIVAAMGLCSYLWS